MDLTAEQGRILLNVARYMIRTTLGARSSIEPNVPNDATFQQPAGAFVTLHSLVGHRLRGCVGRLDCSDTLINSVRHAAASVLTDPRFTTFPVCLHELQDLELEITLILPMEPAAGVLDFDLLSDGIYLTVDNRSGVFLPQVARETGWNREQLLARLCTEKLGLPAESWKLPSAKMMKFKTVLIGPEPFVASPQQHMTMRV